MAPFNTFTPYCICMACPPLNVSDVRLYNMVEIFMFNIVFMFIMVVYLCYTHIISTPSQHQNMIFMTKTFNDCVLLLVM